MDAQQASDNMNVDSQQNTNALSKEDTGEMNVPNSTTENKADNTQVNDSYSNTNMEEIYAMKDCPIITDNIKDMSIEEMRKTALYIGFYRINLHIAYCTIMPM